MTTARKAHRRLSKVGKVVRQDFKANRRVLSFGEYLTIVQENPGQQLRGAASYLRDVFDHYGEEGVAHPSGEVRRFKLFDAPWDEGQGRLIGQEAVQNRLYGLLNNFARQGRVDRCILLHGPNGSSKSTIIDVMARAMENYSSLDEGALYRFNWVFPTHASEHVGIGFGDSATSQEKAESYAHLDDTAIDARIPCELRDHPLLVIPEPMRGAFVEQLGIVPGSQDGRVSEYVMHGDLCHKCKQIYEALLSAYEGDFERVLRHVQVERFYVSRRYRAGTARVEPQLAVDARTRQITVDRSLSALPASLQNVTLHELDGPLVSANRGLIDYADLFKRPLEAFKYLLTAVESGQVALDQSNLFFDLVFVGSANEGHLNAFMESPEWMSFKARVELVKVPYLLDFRQEREIYRSQLGARDVGKPIAPHAIEAAALWAVLTRVRRPVADQYEEPVKSIVANLTPQEKVHLYGDGRVPAHLGDEAGKLLRASTPQVYRESESSTIYEGRTGASPREVRAALMSAAQNPRHECLTPEAVVEELQLLVGQKSVYGFLRQEAQGPGYFDHVAFIEDARQWCLDRVDDEIRVAMGLVEESSYGELFSRYVTHVTHFVRGEKLRNTVTGGFDEPDARLMEEMEKMLQVEGEAMEFRQGMMTRIGAWSVDNQGQKPDYPQIFRDHFKRMKDRYYAEQRKRVKRLLEQTVAALSGAPQKVDAETSMQIQRTRERLAAEFGYCDECAREVLSALARHRYAK